MFLLNLSCVNAKKDIISLVLLILLCTHATSQYTYPSAKEWHSICHLYHFQVWHPEADFFNWILKLDHVQIYSKSPTKTKSEILDAAASYNILVCASNFVARLFLAWFNTTINGGRRIQVFCKCINSPTTLWKYSTTSPVLKSLLT